LSFTTIHPYEAVAGRLDPRETYEVDAGDAMTVAAGQGWLFLDQGDVFALADCKQERFTGFVGGPSVPPAIYVAAHRSLVNIFITPAVCSFTLFGGRALNAGWDAPVLQINQGDGDGSFAGGCDASGTFEVTSQPASDGTSAQLDIAVTAPRDWGGSVCTGLVEKLVLEGPGSRLARSLRAATIAPILRAAWSAATTACCACPASPRAPASPRLGCTRTGAEGRGAEKPRSVNHGRCPVYALTKRRRRARRSTRARRQ
jgi:hypothetical protein